MGGFFEYLTTNRNEANKNSGRVRPSSCHSGMVSSVTNREVRIKVVVGGRWIYFLFNFEGGANPCNAGEKDKFAVNTVWSYCPVKRMWYRETSMITPRRNFGLIAFDKRLYAIGGQDKTGRYVF